MLINFIQGTFGDLECQWQAVEYGKESIELLGKKEQVIVIFKKNHLRA